MLSKNIESAFNEQINAELYSAYLYFAMSAWAQEQNLPGFANWMRLQALEETSHADKFYNFVIERRGRVRLAAIAEPPAEWKSPLALFQNVLEHEEKVTGLINDLVTLANEEKDYASNAFLQWFVTEQVEEEASADEIVQLLRRVSDAPGGLFMLDQQLAKRALGGAGQGA